VRSEPFAARLALPTQITGRLVTKDIVMNTKSQGAVAIQREEQSPVPAPASESAAILQIIERAARDPSVDLDKMERLMAMRERSMAQQAEYAFIAAMKAAQAEMPQVVRDAKNTQTNSRYARYETISEAIQPVITKHGFSLSFGEDDCPKENHLRIVCDVMHEAGHTRRYHADIPVDNVGMKGSVNKTATHAYGSTKSYGKRYLKCDIFDVAVTDQDDDGNAAGTPGLTEEQVGTLIEMLDSVGANREEFCAWAKVEKLSQIAAKDFQKAVAAIKSYQG
jgi:hypothetical protein